MERKTPLSPQRLWHWQLDSPFDAERWTTVDNRQHNRLSYRLHGSTSTSVHFGCRVASTVWNCLPTDARLSDSVAEPSSNVGSNDTFWLALWQRQCSTTLAYWSSATVSFTVLYCIGYRRSQDFVWGALFCQKKLTFFVVVALKDLLNIPSNLSHPTKNVLKIDSCSGWGCTSCPGGALTHFYCKLVLKNFFTALGVQVHPLHPLATPMDWINRSRGPVL